MNDELVAANRFFALVPVLLCVADRGGRFVRLNPAWHQVTGFAPEELVGQEYRDLVHPEDRDRTDLETARLAGGSYESVEFENRYRCRDGSYRLLAWRAVSPDGVDRIYATARDITEERAGQLALRRQQLAIEELNRDLERRVAMRTAELTRANGELEAFSYSVSHDLRSPLRALDGYSQALLEDFGDRLDDEGRRYLERIRVASQRMGGLIDDVLALSRVTRGGLQPTGLDVSALATEITDELRAAHPERRVTVRIDPDLTMTADPRLMRLALVNLLSNAWKFTANREDAEIVVQQGVDAMAATNAVVVVRDNGAGFDPRYADRLFKAFSRLHTQAEFPGSGVGLATVARVAQRHGGRVWAEAQLGEGAAFHLAIPQAPQEVIDAGSL